MNSVEPEDYRVEEYKSLRSEILRHMEASERNIVACLTANGVALAYGVKDANLFVLIVACLIPIYFWIQHTFYRHSIAKIGSYIAVFIEDSAVHLMWENRLQRVDLRASKLGLLYSLKTLLLPYPILLVVSGLTTFVTLGSSQLPPWLVLVGSISLCAAVFVLAKLADVQYVYLRAKWKDAFLDVKRKEKECEQRPDLKAIG